MKLFKPPNIGLDVDDIMLIIGTACVAVGVWGYDWRLALIVLGIWLICLAAKGGKGGGR